MTAALDGFRRHVLDQRAMDLLSYLENVGGQPAADAMRGLQWNRNQFDTAVQHAREVICPALGLTIPHPVPADGFTYRVTGEWLATDGSAAIEAGTSYALGHIEARLRGVLRDVKVAQGNLDPQSVYGRKVNYLGKHLLRILTTLSDIGSSSPAVTSRDEVA